MVRCNQFVDSGQGLDRVYVIRTPHGLLLPHDHKSGRLAGLHAARCRENEGSLFPVSGLNAQPALPQIPMETGFVLDDRSIPQWTVILSWHVWVLKIC